MSVDASVLTAPLAHVSPMDPRVLGCPVEFNERMRREAPVHRCPHAGIVFVFEHAAIQRIAADHATFSNRFGAQMRLADDADPRVAAAMAEGYPAVDTMLTQDPPLHRRYRGLVNQAFTLRRVRTLEPYIEGLAHALVDAFVDAGRCEFVKAFCEPLPLTVIADQLGVPREDLGRFKAWSDAFVVRLGRATTGDAALAAVQRIVEFQHYFAAKLEERRAQPQDDILSDIVHARLDGERPLDTAESLSILQQLLVAGNETTTASLAEGMALLVAHPDQLALLRAAAPDRRDALLVNMVEEVLRLASPTANMWRICTVETEVGGVTIPKGALVQLRYASGSRDEAVFEAPDRFDITRSNAGRHLAFGHGVHQCIGASLARMELKVAFRVLLERLDGLALDCPAGELDYPPNALLRGLRHLPIRFRARTRAAPAAVGP